MNLLGRIVFVFLVASDVTPSDAYRILGVFPFNGKSHNNMFEALMKGLAIRGHQVDAITHFPIKNAPKTYRTIINLAGTLPDVTNNFTVEMVLGFGTIDIPFLVNNFGNNLCDIMGTEEMQALIKSPPKHPPYDVIITEVKRTLANLNFISQWH